MKLRSLYISSFAVALFGAALYAKSTLEKRYKFISQTKAPAITREEADYLRDSAKIYSLGFDIVMADLLWVELLQKSSHEKYVGNEVSWEFAQVHAINALDPEFDHAYSFGSIFLGILKEDRLGAKEVLENWVKKRPRSWRAHYHLGFHLYYDLQDYEKGSQHILQAARMEDAPPYLSALGVRLLSQTGSLAQALKISLDLFSTLRPSPGKDRLAMRIRRLNYSLQEAAWSEALEKYLKAGRKPASVKELRPFLATTLRGLSSLLVGNENEAIARLLGETFEFTLNPSATKIVPVKSPKELGLGELGIIKPKEKQ